MIILFIPSHATTRAVLASGGSIYISTCTFAYWSDRNIRLQIVDKPHRKKFLGFSYFVQRHK